MNKSNSALYCEHANESPYICPCPNDCYCSTRTCKNKAKIDVKSAQWGKGQTVPSTPMKRVCSPDDVPMGQHYAVLIYKSYTEHVEGDERSRMAPGHGYPAHDRTVNDFEHWVTTDKQEWVAFVKKTQAENDRAFTKHPFVFFEVAKRGTLKIEVTMDVE